MKKRYNIIHMMETDVSQEYIDKELEENLYLVNYTINRYYSNFRYLKEDMFSHGLWALYRAIVSYKEKTPPVSKKSFYIRRIRRWAYQSVEHVYKPETVTPFSLDADEDYLTKLIDMLGENDNLDHIYDRSVQQILGEEFYGTLTDKQKQLCHFIYDGLNYQDIGDVWKCTQSNVFNTLYTIRAKAKKFYNLP